MHGSHAGRARVAARLSLVGATLCLLAGLSAGARPAIAAPSGTLSMSPGNSSIENGDDISITLDVVGGVNVHRVLIGVTFNPIVVQAADANSGAAGIQILPGAFPGTTLVGNVLQNDANNTTGVLTYEYTLSSASAQVSGNGTIATVQFHAVAAGNANIQWTVGTFTDNAAANTASSSSAAATLMVGQAVPTSTPTPTGTASSTPTSTDTPLATDTPAPGATDTPTPGPTNTAVADPTNSPTPPSSATPRSTNTAGPTATPRITVIDDSNKAKPPQSGVEQAGKSPGLPSAGNSGPGIQWWRWVFFLAALMLAIAGWFFTFALHYGDREPVLLDRGDRRRRRRY